MSSDQQGFDPSTRAALAKPKNAPDISSVVNIASQVLSAIEGTAEIAARIDEAAQGAVDAINGAKDSAVTVAKKEILQKEELAKEEVKNKKLEALAEVRTKKADAVKLIEKEKNAALAAIRNAKPSSPVGKADTAENQQSGDKGYMNSESDCN